MQETETLNLPLSNKIVVIRGYVSGLIDQEVQKERLSGNKASYELDSKALEAAQGDKLPESGKMVMITDPTAGVRADQKLLKLMLISVDDKNGEEAYDVLMALPKQDVDIVAVRVKELAAAGEVGSDAKKAI